MFLSCCLISGRDVGADGVRFSMDKCGQDKSILSLSCCMINGRVVGVQGVRFLYEKCKSVWSTRY